MNGSVEQTTDTRLGDRRSGRERRSGNGLTPGARAWERENERQMRRKNNPRRS